jgi:general secretion pathway protein F
MGAFRYEAIDADGRTARGVLEADTARGARSVLRDRGLNPLEVEAVADRSVAAPSKDPAARWIARAQARRRSLGRGALALFARELSTLVGAGLPLDEALSALVEQDPDEHRRALVAQLRSRVMEGRTLAMALVEFPDSFDEPFRATVAAGEAGGRLDESLARLAEQAESTDALARQVFGALAYPLLLALVAIGVVSGLLASVVPRIVGVFETLGQELPWITRALLFVSEVVRDQGIWILIGVLLLSVLGVAAWQRENVRERIDRLWLRVPVFGRLERSADTARASRTLATLIGTGVPVLDAIRLAAGTVRNRPMREALRRAGARVREGAGFARSLGESGLFPPVALRLIASGERSGRLDQMLDEVARHQQREVETLLGTLTAVLAPLMILVVGALVLVIVLAIMLPIFDLNQMVR